jgi:hypothetical protein
MVFSKKKIRFKIRKSGVFLISGSNYRALQFSVTDPFLAPILCNTTGILLL